MFIQFSVLDPGFAYRTIDEIVGLRIIRSRFATKDSYLPLGARLRLGTEISFSLASELGMVISSSPLLNFDFFCFVGDIVPGLPFGDDG